MQAVIELTCSASPGRGPWYVRHGYADGEIGHFGDPPQPGVDEQKQWAEAGEFNILIRCPATAPTADVATMLKALGAWLEAEGD